MQNELIELCIGAILHDVGKIGERAQIDLSDQSERIKPQICPTQKDGFYGYLHTACTNEFFNRLQNWLPQELNASQIANIAAYHHKPNQEDALHHIICQADRLSAGQDRSIDESQKREAGERDVADSIFACIQPIVKKDWKRPLEGHLPLKPLEIDETIFPTLASSNPIQEHKNLWEALLEHFSRIPPTQPSLFLNQLIWIFGLYSWSVRSHRSQFPEISLLDHSLTTAAFACALYQYHRQTGTWDPKAIEDKSITKFRIIQGDLSGIQSYLYEASLDNPAGLSKRLRAKSFYLNLITRLAGSLLLKKTGLPEVNRIIDAGGNFILLVHNTPECLQAIQQAEKQIADWFRRVFAGKLHLNLCYETELSGDDFRSEKFYKIQQTLAYQMDRAKKQTQKAILTEDSHWLPNAFLLSRADLEEEGENADRLPENVFFEELGRKLTSGNFLLISQTSIDQAFSEPIASLPLACPFDAFSFAVQQAPSANPDLLGCFELVPGSHAKDLRQIRSGLFLANYIPRQTEQDRPFYQFPQIHEWIQQQSSEEEGEPVFSAGKSKSFAHLCADAFRIVKEQDKTEVKGEPLLAVLKADVDRLGMLFSKTLEGAKAPLSWYISLSRQLNLFFSGILPNWFLNPPKEHPDFRNIYTIYAGGDDLLLVGPWTTLLQFASFLRRQFKQYVCGHPEISLSAGIALCHSRFPLSQAAKQADEALDKAKEKRDRICIFNTPLSWETFETVLSSDVEFFNQLITEQGKDGIKAAKGFIYRLLRYARMAEECATAKKKINIRNLLWRSHLRYDIARNIKTLDKNDKKPVGLQRLEELTALTTKPDSIEQFRRLKVAAICCLYQNR